MSISFFRTIRTATEGFYKDKGSKFLAFAYPVKEEEEVKEYLKDLKTTYYDARHHCYAFIMGPEGGTFRAGDDGEPSNSAGAPILNQIRSAELTNIVVIVVRYFGGTKLGVSGLIEAYKTATADALNKAEIVQDYEKSSMSFSFDYTDMNPVMRTLEQEGVEIVQQDFTENCTFQLEVAVDLMPDLKKNLESIVSVVVTME